MYIYFARVPDPNIGFFNKKAYATSPQEVASLIQWFNEMSEVVRIMKYVNPALLRAIDDGDKLVIDTLTREIATYNDAFSSWAVELVLQIANPELVKTHHSLSGNIFNKVLRFLESYYLKEDARYTIVALAKNSPAVDKLYLKELTRK